MSIGKKHYKGFKSSQKLFLMGVTTFGAMLVFVNSPQFTNTAYASETSQVNLNQNNSQSALSNKDSSDVVDNNSNDNNNDSKQIQSYSANLQQTNSQQINEQQNNNYSAVNTKTNLPTKTNDSSNNVNAKSGTTQIQATSLTSKNTQQMTTTIGNSVKDTQTYQSIQKTTDKMNNNSVDLNQAYFGLAGDPVVDQQIQNLNTESAANLKDNGYIIKSGIINNQKTLVVQGKDATGLFYAINNLNNLIDKQADLSQLNITEEPQMSIRGVIEGFYGEPWSQQARKDLFKFMGEHKMNVYIYSPKDDDYLRKNWKELYPQDKLNEIKDLISAANANHVSFVYTLSPGNDITYSSQEDFDKTVAKLNQLRSIGVTQFYIALDDIPLGMTAADAAIFKNHPTTNYPNNSWSALADAQAYYLNRVQREYIKKNNLPDLWFVPTNYNGSAQDPFKEAQGEVLDKNIRLQWTGEGVFSGDITNESVEQAKKTYHSDHLFIWDNFPVNDSDQDRLYLNPLEGRSKDLYKIMDGFTSNPMIQPYASWFGLAGFGDYMWNANKYGAIKTQQETVRELAGSDPKALVALQSFVDLNQYWDYATDENKVHAPILSVFINNFENATYGTVEYQNAKNELLNRLQIIVDSPTTLQNMKTIGFYNDSLPWINASSHWAQAMIASIELLDSINSGQANANNLSNSFNTLLNQVNLANEKAIPDSRTGKPDLVITPSVGDGVFQKFIEKATSSLNQWLGSNPTFVNTNRVTSNATTDIPQNGDHSASNMNDNNLGTKFWSNRSVKTGDTIKIDLNGSQEIQRIDIHQGAKDSDTTGDLFKDATIYAANNEDGSDKIAIGKVTPTGYYQLNLNQPINAKYLFIVANSDSGNWLQIRNISVFGKTGLDITNLEATNDSGAESIFDGNVQTLYSADLINKNSNAVIQQNINTTSQAKSLYLVGKVSGTVYIHTNNEWKELGRVNKNQSVNQFVVSGKAIDGIKLVVDSNSQDVSINEFGLSNN